MTPRFIAIRYIIHTSTRATLVDILMDASIYLLTCYPLTLHSLMCLLRTFTLCCTNTTAKHPFSHLLSHHLHIYLYAKDILQHPHFSSIKWSAPPLWLHTCSTWTFLAFPFSAFPIDTENLDTILGGHTVVYMVMMEQQGHKTAAAGPRIVVTESFEARMSLNRVGVGRRFVVSSNQGQH